MMNKTRLVEYASLWRCYLLAFIFLPLPAYPSQQPPILQLDPGGHMALISDIIFTSDGRHLVSAGDDKVIRIWDVAQGRTIRTLRGEVGPGNHGKIYAMALAPDELRLAAGGYMATYTGENKEEVAAIRLYDFVSGEIIGLLKGHQNVVVALAFSPDGKKLVSADQNGVAIIWEVEQQHPLHILEGHQASINSVAFTTDSKRVVTGSDDGELRLWEVADGKPISRLRGHKGPVLAVATSLQGGYVASGGSDKTIRLWDDRSGTLLKTFAKQDTEIGSLSFSPDGHLLLAGDAEGTGDCHVYRVMDGKQVTSYSGHDNIVLATAIDPSGRLAATGGGSNQEIHLWPLQTGKLEKRLAGVGATIWSVAFSADGKRLAWERTGPDAENGTLSSHYEMRLPDENDPRLGVIRPLTSPEKYVKEKITHGNWDLHTQSKDTLEIRHHKETLATVKRTRKDGYKHRSFTFTPNGKTVISGGNNGALSAYDLQGRKLGDFIGHTSEVWAVAVSPDGRFLASASSDQTVRLWNIDNHALVLTLFHGTNDEWVAWTVSGFYAASPHGDRYVGWHQNRGADKAAEYYPASRFSAQRYRPELVVDTLLLRSEAETLARWQQTNPDDQLAISVADLIAGVPQAPRIVLGEVRDSLQTLEIEVDAQTDCLVVNHNGRPTRGLTRKSKKDTLARPATPKDRLTDMECSRTRGLSRVKKNQVKKEWRRITGSVTLHPGSNRIEIIARNAQGDSPTVNVEVAYQPVKQKPNNWLKPNLFMLAIGVSEYKDANLNLAYAHKDAKVLADRIAAEKGGIYQQADVKVLTNTEANRENILDALSFLKQMTQDDLAILFIAGHGKKDDSGEFYFLPHDVDHERLRSTGVKWDDFYEITRNLPGKVILLADTCHSGDIFGQRKRRAVLDMNQLAREFASADSGVIVFTSSQGQEFSEESPEWGHGAFTKAILQGLAGEADLFKDNVVHQSELQSYVKRQVVELTEGRQHPITVIPEAISDFPLATVPQQSGLVSSDE